jgi:predicted ATPase/DNA-binding SARP family transcriptional activator
MARTARSLAGIATPAESPQPLRLQLLGGFRAAVGEREIDPRAWKLRRAAAIVKLLALAPERRLHREQMIDLLWPDLDPEVAAHNLNQALYVARRVLEPSLGRKQPSRYLPLQGQVLALCPDVTLDLDVAAFEAAADRANHGDDPAAVPAALALYSGELLPDDRYEDWASARREALRARFHGLLLALAGSRERDGCHDEAIAALARLVADEPTHEAAHVGLMRLYALTGQRARALKQYQQLHEVVGRELAVAPDPASERLYQEILTGRFPPTGTTGQAPRTTGVDASLPPHNLPSPLTSFIGRREAVTTLTDLFAAPGPNPAARLVTLTGSGGCGKTRLALAVAAALVPRYPGGVWLVDLAPVADPSLVAKAVAQVLSVKEEVDRPVSATLAGAVRDRRLLIVLDNCEHLVGACADLAQQLLAHSPGLSILATSREALRVPGERPWRVPSLSFPAAASPGGEALVAAVRDSEAGQLFLQRASFLRPDFALDAATAAAIAAICRRLDGIPLALELAAARVTVLGVEEIAARLDSALPLLSGGDRTAPTRQHTLRATLDWSYALLPPHEQRLLRHLAVFAGGWTLPAAEAIYAPEPDNRLLGRPGEVALSAELRPVASGFFSADTLSLLAALVDKSLVQVELGHETARYRLLEMVRQYAWELLAASGEATAAQRRHAAHYAMLAEATPDSWYTPRQQAQVRLLERDHENLRAALAWGLTQPGEDFAPCIAGSLWVFWFMRGSVNEARRWLDAALAHPRAAEIPAAYSQILNGIGYISSLQGDVSGATAAYEARLAWQRSRGDRQGMISTLSNLSMVVREQLRDYRRAYALAEEAVAIVRELGLSQHLSILLNSLGLTVRYLGDFARARSLHEEALAIARQAGDLDNEASTLANLAMLALEQGQHGEARQFYQQSLAIIRQLGKAGQMVIPLTFLAEVASAQGQPARAARLFGAAEALSAAQGYRLPAILQDRCDHAVATLRAQLSPAELAAAWAAGRALPLDDALDEALAPA